MTSQVLTDKQRGLIHDLALEARSLLTREARELLEGTYGLYADGRLDPLGKLPQVQADPETAETYRRMAQFLDDETHAGLARADAVDKLVKEVAFTHLNRLVAFKMMEARGLIRGTLDRDTESNGFKYYLADPDHAADLALYERGEADAAYRRFLLWQAGQVAQEIRVLFDPDTLPSRLFPRPRALHALLEMLNRPDLAEVWRADETVGWVYQYFNEPELQAAFERVRTTGTKFEAKDIPSATQLFTPHWIVKFLVQNTLGRLWVRMHPDTRLLGTETLDYLVPLEGEQPPELLRPVSEITLLDPACGGMHFGMVAFDLFAAMYREELERAGEDGWPESPSVSDPAEIPAAILKHNLFGIDIDLRAVQLSALALYLKAKSLNPHARIVESNLACADVLPLDGAKLGAFLREAHFTRPIYERLIRALWERLRDAQQLGSLLRLERELGDLIAQERAQYERAPLFAGLPGEFEAEAAEEEFWGIISAQIVQGLDEFVRQHARAGDDLTFFSGEAVKGLRLVDLMLRRYDVVVTNPPYMSKMNRELATLIADSYPEGKQDLFAAFIQRCLGFTQDHGYVGMLTMHSFMFLSSYKALREHIRSEAVVQTMVHCGPGLFDVGNPGTLQTTAFVLQKKTDSELGEKGAFYRLVHASTGNDKRLLFEEALKDGTRAFYLAPHQFDTIPGSPWAYWVPDSIREAFVVSDDLSSLAHVKLGLSAVDVSRFNRSWWEVDKTSERWFPLMKGGGFLRWYGYNNVVTNWYQNGVEVKQEVTHRYPYLKGNYRLKIRDEDWLGKEGLTYTNLANNQLSVRLMPTGALFDDTGPAIFSERIDMLSFLGLANSPLVSYLLTLMNPSIHFQKGDLERLPVPGIRSDTLQHLARKCVWIAQLDVIVEETSYEFKNPPHWLDGLNELVNAQSRLAALETQIDDEVYRLYDISAEDRAAIEAELAGGALAAGNDEDTALAEEDEAPELPMTREELAVRWISYAVGMVLGRFQPGVPGALGCAVYRREDFAVGSLPAPDEDEFDQLVGSAARFACVDDEGGRHVFPAEVEAALGKLALPDGIAVLDEGHPRDLPTLVERALTLMLGAQAAQEVIAEGCGGDLRKFLDKDFFTRWHLRWYRKRPVYWPLQSAKRGCGFVLFHEKIDKSTLYVLQRDYLDHKLNGLRLQIGDLQGQAEGLSGTALKRVERDIDRGTQLLDELSEFAATMARIVQEGYEPQPDWIDDGVILRMAPLWELVPIWKSEPKRYWERLEHGDYDWSHIAMRYWPERVREACRENKSFAIAHGYEEWHEGG